jgi:serine/threonine protein kinase
MGSYLYSAPEQFASELDDPRLDLYAWAAVFFELLTGQPLGQLLTGESSELSFVTLLLYYSTSRDDELPASFFADRGLPQQLVPILQKALRQNPECRYTSAEELLTDLSDAQRVLTIPDDKAEAHYRLGMERWENGDLQGAVEHLEKVGPEAQQFQRALTSLEDIYDIMGNRAFRRMNWLKAIEYWRAAMYAQNRKRTSE